jgi:hypothetical protein
LLIGTGVLYRHRNVGRSIWHRYAIHLSRRTIAEASPTCTTRTPRSATCRGSCIHISRSPAHATGSACIIEKGTACVSARAAICLPAAAVVDKSNIALCIHGESSSAPAIRVDHAHFSGPASIQPGLVRDIGETTRKAKQGGEANNRCANNASTISHD